MTMLVTTTNNIEGRRIVDYLGVVAGEPRTSKFSRSTHADNASFLMHSALLIGMSSRAGSPTSIILNTAALPTFVQGSPRRPNR